VSIPFVRPWLSGRELVYVNEALAGGQLGGDGPFGRRCAEQIARQVGSARVLITGSATHAMEMAFLALDLAPGDEVIMPSFTFASTANAVALRGAVPVFVDIRPDTLNLDERLVEQAVTDRTRALLPVHYAGIGCVMDVLMDIAARHGLAVVEDAAHAIGATWQGRALGGIGALGALSFHQTKNLSAGEGGALLINDPALVERAEIVWEKGTNRRQFARGEVDRYTWIDLGSSYLASELVTAVLLAQLEALDTITRLRLDAWRLYDEAFAPLERAGRVHRPVVPADCAHNGHIYYLLCEDEVARNRLIASLKSRGISAVFHYVPLHSSPAGQRLGRTPFPLGVTETQAARLVRLPIYAGITEVECHVVIRAVTESLG
jgi:dTDP-4-amino-4,6-dideoxygalactose transaminase